MNETLSNKIQHLPTHPGVYLFKDQGETILYVGKAKRLRNRVRSYFQPSAPLNGKVRALVRRICDLEVITTDSEAEALILEANLIKKHRPRYNILYRDDKTYPYICVTNEERPRIFPTRTVVRDGSRYYGPYDHVGKMKTMLETIRQTFDLCTCACSPRIMDHGKGLPDWNKCFEDYFQQCSAELPLEEYQERVHKIMRLLNGKMEGLIKELREEMEMSSQALAFEKAAMLRDGIHALQKYSDKMKMVTSEQVDRDVFALEADYEQNIACGVVFRIREGKLIGSYHRYIRNIEGLTDAQVLQSFLEDYYISELTGHHPDEVHVSHELEDEEPLLDYLWQQAGRKVPISQPKKGEKAQLVRMACSNARLHLNDWKLQKQKADRDRVPHVIGSLQRDLHLQRAPRRIECFDISNLQGTDTTASLVCFVDGQARTSEYKRYAIRSVSGPDDYASMQEVVRRRYERLRHEGKQVPDLIVIDGGKGQLSSALEALKQAGFEPGELEVVGLAKRLEEIYFPGRPEPLMIPKTSSSLKLLQRIRDEAHRFAVTYHRKKRSKRTLRSDLEQVPGVGSKTAQKLLRRFGSLKAIQQAGRQELEDAAGKAVTENLLRHFSAGDS